MTSDAQSEPGRPDDGAGDDLPWSPFDETLLGPDEAPPGDSPPADAQLRSELIRQRLGHALLRSSFDTRAAADARVQGIMERISEAPGTGDVVTLPTAKPASLRRIGWSVAAAAALLIGFGTWFWGGVQPEQVEAALRTARAGTFFGEASRSFELSVRKLGVDGEPMDSWTHSWTCDGYGRFRAELNGGEVGNNTVGCNGEQVWRIDKSTGEQTTGGLDDVEAVFGQKINDCGLFRIGRMGVGLLMDAIVEAAPRAEVTYAGPVRLVGHDGELHKYRVGELKRFGKRQLHVSWMEVHVDLDARVVERLEAMVQSDRHDGHFQIDFRESGATAVDKSFYDPPPAK